MRLKKISKVFLAVFIRMKLGFSLIGLFLPISSYMARFSIGTFGNTVYFY